MKWKSLLSATLALACTGMLLSGCGGAAGTNVKSEQEASAPAPAVPAALALLPCQHLPKKPMPARQVSSPSCISFFEVMK